jgi:predicted transcriptional regulator
MLDSLEEICKDVISRRILKLLSNGWFPIKELIPKFDADKHTIYRRFKALEKFSLIEKSKNQHASSRYRVYGYCLSEAGRRLVDAEKSVSAVNIRQSLHSFEHNYSVKGKVFIYPNSKENMFKSKIVNRSFQMGLNHLLMELTRDENVIFGNSRLIIDIDIESIALIDVYEFYNDCLSPALRSYVEDRTFYSEKNLTIKIIENPSYAKELIKLIKFTVNGYNDLIGDGNLELINAALEKASKESSDTQKGWASIVSSLLITTYFFMLASIYQVKGELPEPERYFELWYFARYDLPKLKDLYQPLLERLTLESTNNLRQI